MLGLPLRYSALLRAADLRQASSSQVRSVLASYLPCAPYVTSTPLSPLLQNRSYSQHSVIIFFDAFRSRLYTTVALAQPFDHQVPPHIPRPDYANTFTGESEAEKRVRGSTQIIQHPPESIAKARHAGKVCTCTTHDERIGGSVINTAAFCRQKQLTYAACRSQLRFSRSLPPWLSPV